MSYMAGSASFRLVASSCCAEDWLARADVWVGAAEAEASWRTFCWLSALSEETTLVVEKKLPRWAHGRAGADRRARETPRNRGEADMVTGALLFHL